MNFSNEIKTEDNKGNKLKLDGACIKKLSGGGDELTARLNYKDQITFKIQGRFMFFANDMIDVSPNDALKTLSVFKFQSEFKDEITDEEKRINELGQYKFCKSDPNIKNIF